MVHAYRLVIRSLHHQHPINLFKVTEITRRCFHSSFCRQCLYGPGLEFCTLLNHEIVIWVLSHIRLVLVVLAFSFLSHARAKWEVSDILWLFPR
jgi:hypothetical protein